MYSTGLTSCQISAVLGEEQSNLNKLELWGNDMRGVGEEVIERARTRLGEGLVIGDYDSDSDSDYDSNSDVDLDYMIEKMVEIREVLENKT